ncbi:alpha/beta fold hydrolase [Chryseobacterium wangxinyae]|uniref:alpha/beta fold hydrolase n=1 Tax=Chryseobacterium sp. CY353 TaxID=2997334 RepID=UPI00226E2E3A|nr:alpha/beta hydrolase [Chryseobacterium sp. CY353]MCY0968776.1 alpha/beta hydrolase [Chryseobacterium sp. CY353]
MRNFHFKLIIFIILLSFSKTFGQYFMVCQPVEIEKYRGKNFILEGKIFYNSEIKNDSWVVLSALFVDEKGKGMKNTINNDDAQAYYKNGNWSSYQLQGKIEKKAKFIAVGITVAGSGSYHVDDFKLFIQDGKNKIEIPVRNAGFEDASLTPWQAQNIDKDTRLSLANDQYFSGKQSLFVDNSNVKMTPTFGNNKENGKFMDVNGVKLYYEVYGKGEPLLLIHGNNSSMASFNQQIDVLSKKYMVIGLDSRGQGKSSSDDQKLTYELMADDINVFLEKINLKKVNILGWSDGGNIAVILGMEHPDKVKKMAIMGAVLYNNETSVFPEINKILNEQVKEMKKRGVSENDMNYRLKILLLTEPNINPDSLKKIQAPTLVMAGEHDVTPEKHTKLIAEKIPNGKMLIFKGADHEAPSKIPEKFNQAVLDFFE